MNIQNIEKMLNHLLIKSIREKDENYLGYKIIDRGTKQFNALFWFFKNTITDKDLDYYSRQVKELSKGEGVCVSILNVYDLKILVFS